MASILDDAKATSSVAKLMYGIDTTAIILSSFAAGSAIYQLANSRRHIYDEAPTTDSEKDTRSRLLSRPRRDLFGVRLLILAAAVFAILRSGLHIVSIQAETSRRYIRANGGKFVPAADRARNIAYLWFEVGAVFFFFTALIHLKTQFFLWALTPTRRRLSRLEDGFLIAVFLVLWLAVCVPSTIANLKRLSLKDIVNSSIASIYTLSAWMIVATIAISTSVLTKLIHSSRAKITCLERVTLARFSMVVVPILVADVAIIISAFIVSLLGYYRDANVDANYVVDVVVEVLGASVVLVWVVGIVRKLESCPER
ncbi:hypothetical protein B0T19DRAFT_442383 [Cercophora scortea]|uniref:Uncharacterized protein n=1 Tax=Cercophora scortea TaxID=314031 RepID=A0AAE0IQ72_9PEZI|nr:hypothetical protein B0T19DRAFT_442383 [Cercophora scortea]